jgi:hypothetical protein
VVACATIRSCQNNWDDFYNGDLVQAAGCLPFYHGDLAAAALSLVGNAVLPIAQRLPEVSGLYQLLKDTAYRVGLCPQHGSGPKTGAFEKPITWTPLSAAGRLAPTMRLAEGML